MSDEAPSSNAQSPPPLPSNGGEMGRLVRSKDWSKHQLGMPETWPQSLRTSLGICLSSKFPTVIYWGPKVATFYNDGYAPILGAKHPQALGKPVQEVWPELWDVIESMIDGVIATGESTWSEDKLLIMQRKGFTEESYFTWSFAPIQIESGERGGLYVAVTETTQQVIGERRLRMLRDLGVAAAKARTVEDACQDACQVIEKSAEDIPFSLIYLLDPRGEQARLVASHGLQAGTSISPSLVNLGGNEKTAIPWPLEVVARSGNAEVVNDVVGKCGTLQCAPWPEPISSALVLPILQSGGSSCIGLIVAGVSPRLALDDRYRSFYELVAGQVGAALANASAYEEERKRAEKFAELDRAKTTFFSNVSHEFRTPLTLMLGPLEDLLNRPDETLVEKDRKLLQISHRNGLRLLKLVNMLLDFTRIEQGRSLALYEPVDLAVMTAELASVFRSVTEKAGLRLLVSCPKLPEPIYVDREMWEKIVLNLLSNAFKFTVQGEIEVKLSCTNDQVELTVRDTGSGIPEQEMPKLFERFHRVQGVVGRSFEGSGIGLSLVRELVGLHGGSVWASSQVGKGTAFTVSIPTGSKHLPADRIKAPRAGDRKSAGIQAFVEEAERWLPDLGEPIIAEASLTADQVPLEMPPGLNEELSATQKRFSILLADDNTDMRDYIRRLLTSQYQVIAVPDGRAALDVARKNVPDLVLTDVMMPNLDGRELLKELRRNPRTRLVPVIMISARAGEEARLDGLAAGADDYLVKPFSAKDLMARVASNLRLSRMRQEIEHAAGREEALKETNRRKDEFLAMLAHELRNPLAPIRYAMHALRTASDAQSVARSREIVERQVKHMSHLVDELLDVSRITSGKIVLHRERFEFVGFIRQAVDNHKVAIEDAGLKMQLELPDKQVWISADATRVTQILDNLIHNAVKFSKPGGEISIEVVSSQKTAEVSLRVRDTGIGIEPAFLGRLFDPFSQADSSLDRSKGGLGLGLALVRCLAELHGGRVAATSDGLGQGALFVVWFPWELGMEAIAELPQRAKDVREDSAPQAGLH